jgi:hypothetical protein
VNDERERLIQSVEAMARAFDRIAGSLETLIAAASRPRRERGRKPKRERHAKGCTCELCMPEDAYRDIAR